MQSALSTLSKLTHRLPEIKQALGPRWPALAGQIQAQTVNFEQLNSEADLTQATNQLIAVLLTDAAVTEIITRPDNASTEIGVRFYQNNEDEPPERIPLQTIANRFIIPTLEHVDEIANGVPLEEILESRKTHRPATSSNQAENS